MISFNYSKYMKEAKMKEDEYSIDAQKLIYHPERIAQWLKDPFLVYPIYIEISPSGCCNHRCKFCALDYLGYQNVFLDRKLLIKRLKEMAELGVKSIMYGGEGEPLLHREIAEIAVETKRAGLDVAFTTNGVLMTQKFLKKALSSIEWIKVSIDAGTKETYSKIHCCPEKHFEIVLKNLKTAVKIREENSSNCALGAQMLLLPDNYQEATILAKKLKKIRVDYLVIKPYSQHPMSKATVYKDVHYEDYFYLAEELEEIADDTFKVIFRRKTMEKWDKSEKPYQICYSVPFFWAYIDSQGGVWSCSCFLKDKRFYLGNIYQDSFRKIWQGKLRKKNIKFMERFDITQCRINCRLDEGNSYLWKIKHPPKHVNFI